MTQYFPFTPSPLQPFTFIATLDNAQYTCVITWNLSSQRWYVNCYDVDNNLIFSRAAIASLAGIPLSALYYNKITGRAYATTQYPHNYPIGTVVNLTIAGVTPDGYNIDEDSEVDFMQITGPNTFNYPLPTDPGMVTLLGQVTNCINIAAGYFNSCFMFRNGQFEINP